MRRRLSRSRDGAGARDDLAGAGVQLLDRDAAERARRRQEGAGRHGEQAGAAGAERGEARDPPPVTPRRQSSRAARLGSGLHPQRARPHHVMLTRSATRSTSAACAPCPGPRPLADRGLLRRGRLDLRRPPRRHLRRPRQRELLPRAASPSGEGGCVLTGSPALKKLVESFRDWGRDCWCDPGQGQHLRQAVRLAARRSPHGYDHKYTYSHIGYNLKATDMQAAVGVARFDKLPGFIAARRQLRPAARGTSGARGRAGTARGHALQRADWFGFPMLARPDAPFTPAS